jgi:glycosyltransferase involved in cell wall biosynthesis
LIIDEIDGYLFPVGNHEALAEKLFILFSNPDLRKAMGENARKHYLEKYELKNSVLQQAYWLEKTVKVAKSIRSL